MLIIASSLLLLQGLVMAAETTDDYRQPYKFVKPLTELNEMYRRRVVTPEAEKKMPIAEARTGFSSRMDDMVEDNMEEESEMAMMTSSLKAPPPVSELLPKPEARTRTRKRVSLKPVAVVEEKEESEKKMKESMANHRIVEDEVEDEGPKAEAYRARQPPQSSYHHGRPDLDNMEYEYYYDDYYYDDYYDEPEAFEKPAKQKPPPKYTSKYSPSKKSPSSKYPPQSSHSSSISSKYPNFPKTNTKPTSSKYPPLGGPPPKYTSKPSSSPSNKYKKPEPKPSKPSRSSNHKWSSDIDNTIERLNAMKVAAKKRKGTPYEFERYNPDTKYNKERSSAISERRYKPKSSASSKPPAPPARAPYNDYYDDDEYYDDYEQDPFYNEESKYYRNRHIQRSGGGGGGSNPLALLLAPLAGIALLTAAAAVAINPVLVSVSFTGKRRRRRDLDEDGSQGLSPELEEKMNEMHVLERFMSTIPDNMSYQQKVLSMYLSCSGYTEITNRCLDRMVCEYGNAESAVSQEERDVISIVLYNIMANDHVEEDFKDRLRMAARQGRDTNTCSVYECEALHGQFDKNSLE